MFMKILYVLSLLISFGTIACPSLLDTDMRILDSSESENLCKYENKVLLVVNVASRCGYTYQYDSLQKLYTEYKDNDFVILGIPSRDFMFQEFKDESDVAEFCSTEYGVTFPMFATSKVTGPKANPFYVKLKQRTGYQPKWNFNKFLISRDAKIIKTYDQKIEPDSSKFISDLESLL